MRKIREKDKGKVGGNFIELVISSSPSLLFTLNFFFTDCYGFSLWSTLSMTTTIVPTTFQCRKPTLSGIRVPMDEVRSSNQVHMDEMNSSNPVNVFGPMSLDQV